MAIASRPFATCVLDTGPLLSAIAFEFAFKRPLSQQQVILARIPLEPYFKRTANRESFVLLFRSIKTVLTTPHVIAEIQGNRFLHGDLQTEFWLHAIGLFKAKGIEERTLRLCDLDSKGLGAVVGRIGPTDAGLVELAREEGCTLLTEDRRTLAPWAWEQGVDCQILENLLEAS